jgi:hypothetical protein
MPKRKRLPNLKEFQNPIVAQPSPAGKLRVQKTLRKRLDLLCVELNISATDPNRYRKLCLLLLSDVIGQRGFQVIENQPPRRGPETVWNTQRHSTLVRFVDELVRSGSGRPAAIRQARDRFRAVLPDPELGYATVRAEYYRAKRFIKAVPRIAAAMLAIEAVGNGAAGSKLCQALRFRREGCHQIRRSAYRP